MRLERLEIAGFGRLRECRFDFEERITVVLGPNESGKSTLHRAVRAALYGLDAGGPGRPRERSDWARWAPWTGDRYGIALTYRLDAGPRFRVAQSLERGRISAQVQQLGGGDVTDRFRFGRLVSPGRVHLGIDEPVFCAAGWLGDDGLRPAAPDSPPGQSGRLREALERLADTGPDGPTAAEALERLREALRRVGSERRSTSPLGVATGEARRLEAEVDAARRRMDELSDAEEELRRLEGAAAAAAEAAAAAQRAWLSGRIAHLDAGERAAAATADEITALAGALERERAYAVFPLEEEGRLIALGGELHQAEATAAEAEGRSEAAAGSLERLRQRRSELADGLRALGDAPPLGPGVGARMEAVSQRLAVAAALERRDEDTAAASREDALRREIAVTGLGSVDTGGLVDLASLAEALQRGRARLRRVAAGAASAALAGVLAAVALGVVGAGGAALAVAAATLTLLATVGAAGWRMRGGMEQVRRELTARLPGMDLGPEGLTRLAAAIPAAQRLQRERERQAAVLDAARGERQRARDELDGAVSDACALAREVGLERFASPPPGSAPRVLMEMGAAAVAALEQLAARAERRLQLVQEDEQLAARNHELAAVMAEARRRRESAGAIEARIRSTTLAAGIDPSLPPLAAVASFRDACAHRREHERLTIRLGEARRRQAAQAGASGPDPRSTARRRAELEAELRRHGGTPPEDLTLPAPTPAELAELERVARQTQEHAAVAALEHSRLRSRLEGMRGGLPSLADLEDDRLAVIAARDRALHQQAALERAIELIEVSGREVHGRLAPRLAGTVSQRLATLTGDRYHGVNVDMAHFAVALASAERDQMVPLDLVSHGTRDQVALLLRLALCELLGGDGETMPLLLDEPMVASDPARRAALLSFLAELSATNQLVLTASDPSLAAQLSAHAGPDTVAIIDLESGTRMEGVRTG